MNQYLPEGHSFRPAAYTPEELQKALQEQTVLQAAALLCDERHDLHVDLGSCRGIIPRSEAAVGISGGDVRDIAILSRVGKPVSFLVREHLPDGRWLLSRRAAQERALDRLLGEAQCGDILPAVVTGCTEFGAFCDIGCGVPALLGLQNICISRIRHAGDLLRPGQQILTAIQKQDRVRRRISLTMKELLGTWEENVSGFRQGQTVTGIVRSIRDYGAFIELTPNLSGLAEIREPLQEGDAVSVYIKSILPDKLKIKLAVIDRLEEDVLPEQPLRYFVTEGHLNTWLYGSSRFAKSMTIF